MHVYIIHGYCASTSKNWFPWLEKELEKQRVSVSIIDLPSPDDPNPVEWQEALKNQVLTPDRNTYFVSHSLGSIALLHYLEKANTNEVGGYILVSGFNDNLPTLPQLNGFMRPKIDYERLAQITGNRVVIAARDDATVPHCITKNLATSLNATFISEAHGGHFLGSDGFTEFPRVLRELEEQFAGGH